MADDERDAIALGRDGDARDSLQAGHREIISLRPLLAAERSDRKQLRVFAHQQFPVRQPGVVFRSFQRFEQRCVRVRSQIESFDFPMVIRNLVHKAELVSIRNAS